MPLATIANEYITYLEKQLSFNGKGKIFFYSENPARISSELAPFRKVAVLYTAKSFFEHSISFTKDLKSSGLKPINLVLTDITLSVENLGQLFYLPEDTRLIIATEQILFPFAEYFACVKGVPCLLWITNPLGKFLTCSYQVENGRNLNLFTPTAERHLVFVKKDGVITQSIIKEKIANDMLFLLDCKAQEFFNGKYKSQDIYNEMQRLIFSGEIDSAIKLEILKYAVGVTGGRLNYQSAISILSMLAKEDEKIVGLLKSHDLQCLYANITRIKHKNTTIYNVLQDEIANKAKEYLSILREEEKVIINQEIKDYFNSPFYHRALHLFL